MSDSSSPAPLRTVEAWAEQKGISAFAFAGAKHSEAWGEGRELSEADFDAAIARFLSIELR